MIDAARSQGLTLRLLGGLAVREHCRETAFCERPYRDIDLVGLSRQSKAATALIVGSGWQENRHVAMATMGRRRQFFRECRHGGDGGSGGPSARRQVRRRAAASPEAADATGCTTMIASTSTSTPFGFTTASICGAGYSSSPTPSPRATSCSSNCSARR